MRLRTGHGPNDWTQNAPGGAPHRNGGYIQYGGSLIIGESDRDRQRRLEKASRERRAKVLDMPTRWDDMERCGRVTRVGVCVRISGHRSDCMTAQAQERRRLSRRKIA